MQPKRYVLRYSRGELNKPSHIAIELLIERTFRPPRKILLVADAEVDDLPCEIQLNEEIVGRNNLEHFRDFRCHCSYVRPVNRRPVGNVIEIDVGPLSVATSDTWKRTPLAMTPSSRRRRKIA